MIRQDVELSASGMRLRNYPLWLDAPRKQSLWSAAIILHFPFDAGSIRMLPCSPRSIFITQESPTQMRIYELLLPVAKLIDALHIGPGLSLIAVGRKPTGADAPRPAAADESAGREAAAPAH